MFEFFTHIPSGEHACSSCQYRTTKDEYLELHRATFHAGHPMILYIEMNSFEDRSVILDEIIGFPWIDATGCQCAFDDGVLDEFGNVIVDIARRKNLKIARILRMMDPGLDLMFSEEWVEAGLFSGTFTEYEVPEELKC
jgi:hypothetical protein